MMVFFLLENITIMVTLSDKPKTLYQCTGGKSL